MAKPNWGGLLALAALAGVAYYLSGHGPAPPPEVSLPEGSPPPIAGDTQRAIDLAKQQLAASMGGSVDAISVVEAERAQWSSNALGCMLPGYVYNDTTPASGWRILLQTPNGRTYDYRVRSDYLVVELCPYG